MSPENLEYIVHNLWLFLQITTVESSEVQDDETNPITLLFADMIVDTDTENYDVDKEMKEREYKPEE